MIEALRDRFHIPIRVVMMLTSQGQRHDAQRCRLLGIESYLLKPIRLTELRDAAKAALKAGINSVEPPLVQAVSPAPTVMLVPLNILVAEDNAVNRLLITRLLRKRGHTVTVVGDGRGAIAAVAAEDFDIVLMDVQMPVLDGLQANAEIRKNEARAARHVPIVALTAHAMQSDHQRCLDSGMDGYLTKPIDPSALDRALIIHALPRSSAAVERTG